MQSDFTFKELLTWLKEKAKLLRYGEITLTVVLHDGQIRQVEKKVLERERPKVGDPSGT
jgi:hypothetical protein